MRIFLLSFTGIMFLFLTACKSNPKSQEQLCADGVALECTLLGYKHASGAEKNIELSKSYHSRSYRLNSEACIKGDMGACGDLGFNFEKGNGTEKSIAKAFEYYEQACNASLADSCERLARLFYKEPHKDTEKRDRFYSKARQLFSVECEAKKSSSCKSFSRLLERGFGGSVDKVGSFEAAQLACSVGKPKDCDLLAGKYAKGTGTKQDILKAAEIFHTACLDGSYMGCSKLGYNSHQSAGILNKHPEEVKFYKKRCNAKHGGACFMLSRFYLFGDGVKKDKDKFYSLLLKSCDLEFAIGCREAAVQFYYEYAEKYIETKAKKLEGDKADKFLFKSRELGNRACKLGDEKACELKLIKLN